MSEDRPSIPSKVSDRLLADNRHTCCICKLRKDVVIHHIDENSSNNNPQNLAVICAGCHSDVHSNLGHGRKFSHREMKIYKNEWEDRCKVESNKKQVVNNFFVFYDQTPQLNDPEFYKNFISAVTSGTTNNDIITSVVQSADTVLESTGDKSLANDFKLFVLKESKWPIKDEDDD